jgi:hypothetical protein
MLNRQFSLLKNWIRLLGPGAYFQLFSASTHSLPPEFVREPMLRTGNIERERRQQGYRLKLRL